MPEAFRCSACGLNQFMTVSGNCRRCREPLVIRQVETIFPEPPLPKKLIEPPEYTVGDVFRVCRLAVGLSQVEMMAKLSARKAFRSWISRIENNVHNPTFSSICRYAGAFGVSPYFIALMLDPIYEQVPVTRFVASHQLQDPRATISSEEKTT